MLLKLLCGGKKLGVLFPIIFLLGGQVLELDCQNPNYGPAAY